MPKPDNVSRSKYDFKQKPNIILPVSPVSMKKQISESFPGVSVTDQ